MTGGITRRAAVEALEYATAHERLYDFCLWEYVPAAPCSGKLRSVNLLSRSFELHGMGKRGADLVQAIRRGFGDSRTVWGIKQEGGQISWEFYFYDYERLQRERSIPRLLEIIKPWIACEIATSEQRPYFMFSIDLDRKLIGEGKALEEIQMYIGNIGSQVSSGICYAVTRKQVRLKNFYFFFDAKTEMENIVGKATSSAYLDPANFDIDAILWPELLDCQTIVVANKQDRDGVYFSRVNVDQLLIFLKRMRYPSDHVLFVEKNRSSLDHMRYDVGLDYRMEGNDLRIVKSAYYGVF
jgi:hypothetical protein